MVVRFALGVAPIVVPVYAPTGIVGAVAQLSD